MGQDTGRTTGATMSPDEYAEWLRDTPLSVDPAWTGAQENAEEAPCPPA